MITRKVYKLRENNGEVVRQEYIYGLQDIFLKYKKDSLHKFLRNTFLNGLPDVFSKLGVTSASRDTTYIAADKSLNRIYRENKPVEHTIPFPCTVHRGCSHLFSQLCLDSNGFVNKKFVSELGPTNPDAMGQHANVQNYFMELGLAMGMEIPVWSKDGNCTAFIDLLSSFFGSTWILDYKPQCMQAKNKHAVAQLLKCREMLCEQTGRNDYKCAYFDEEATVILNI